MRKSLMADGALLLVAIGWGLNFVVEKNVLLTMTPYMYIGLRFIISALLVVVFFHRKLKHMSKEDVKAGLVVGFFMLLGFLTQAVGLVHTTPSKSGFITGSNVVMVPFIAYLLTKRFPGVWQIVGAVITFGGLALISVNENLTIGYGDILTLLCAVSFALQIVFTGYYVKKVDPLNMAFIQITLTGIITMGITVMQEPVILGLNPRIWGAILFGAVFCTAGALVVQNIAQKYTSPTHAAVILCTESVFAGIFSFLLWGEPLTLKTLSGFALILVGILVTELVPSEPVKDAQKSVNVST